MYLKKNLNEIMFTIDYISKKNSFNIGTGRESLALSLVGFKNVFHYDISPIPVKAVRNFIKENLEFRNVVSTQIDICEPHDLACKGGLDFVYLIGILQHIYDPNTAINNILIKVNLDGLIFFRNYRFCKFI